MMAKNESYENDGNGDKFLVMQDLTLNLNGGSVLKLIVLQKPFTAAKECILPKTTIDSSY